MSENTEQKKAVKWTQAQESAINAKGTNLLVCAAAGSGKTATLTERIIRRLTDTRDPADISRMVVVTFTRNAASELKEKIYKAISQKIAEEPDNRYLPLQLMKLPAARISTIHSFCFEIIKKNLSTLGLPSSVKIADAGDIAIRSHRLMEQVVCDFYDAEEKDGSFDFSMLAESITTTKGEGTLSDMFLALYKKLCSFPGGASNLEAVAGDYDAVLKNDFFDTKYGEVYKRDTEKSARAFLTKYAKIMKALSDEDGAHPYLAALSSDVGYIERILNSLESGYAVTRVSVLGFDFEKLGSVARGKGSINSENAKALRAEAKAWIGDLGKNYAYSPEQLDDAASKTATLSRTLARVLTEYERRFREDKREAGALDFGDLEYYASELLWKNGERTDAAREIEALTDEIYIDEYQDVNELQDSIFRAVSNGKNLFMVGDVKQSIYTFRGGDPSIITGLRKEYLPYTGETSAERGQTVFMQNNFRCDNRVVEYVNGIFDVLLGRAYGQFEYKREDELVYTKDGGVVSENEHYPRFVICENAPENESDTFDPEAVWVAEEIVRLLENETKNNGERIRPGDIALLLRADGENAPRYKRELERRGVPVVSPSKQSPFDTPELQLVMCMLNVIDNPHRDIYLAGILMSELYSVSADELVELRRAYPYTISLYDAVCKFTKEHGWDKGERFIAQNDAFRALARKTPVDRLVWQIFLDTGLLRCAVEKYNSAFLRRKAKRNCMIVYELARNFESGAFKGLYNFIEYLNGVISRGAVEGDGGEQNEDAVHIMSMHGSKGLEFPVCFVCQTGSYFTNPDSKQRLLFEPDVGIGFKLRGEDGFTVCDTPFRRAIDIVKSGLSSEEEMRILYVALTRARERLYVTAKPRANSSSDKMLEKVEYKLETFAEDTVAGISSFAEGIILAQKMTEMPIPIEIEQVSEDAPVTLLAIEGNAIAENADAANDPSETLAVLTERFSFEYPHQALTRIKAKMSVSKLYPSVLDELENEADEHERPQLDFTRKPHFDSESKAPTAAERGIATHLIMQFADFDRMERTGVEAELDRLVAEGYIDKKSAESARLEDVGRFIESSFYQRIKNADKLWREFRFNLRLDAADFTENDRLKAELDGEKLLVQGVIDGFFIEGEDIVLFDYKTDYLTAAELASPTLAAKKLSERHAQQLCYYKMALERIFSKKVDQVYIYSLPLGAEVRIDIDNSRMQNVNLEFI